MKFYDRFRPHVIGVNSKDAIIGHLIKLNEREKRELTQTDTKLASALVPGVSAKPPYYRAAYLANTASMISAAWLRIRLSRGMKKLTKTLWRLQNVGLLSGDHIRLRLRHKMGNLLLSEKSMKKNLKV